MSGAFANHQSVLPDVAALQFQAWSWRSVGQSFRGSITDYTRRIVLGSGYIGKWADTNLCENCKALPLLIRPATCRHFEINTCRQLAGPFTAIDDPNVETMMLLKAAQTAGSTCWDMAIQYLLVHSRYMRIKVYLDSDEKARRYCDGKLMETLKNNPDIARFLPVGENRFDNSKMEFKLTNGKQLVVCGLNDSTASSLPADVVVIDEGWLHQNNGLMKKAIDRAKQVGDRKIIIVGQAGDVKEDQDRIWTSLHKRVPLTWACPCCGGRQQFELHRQRPSDFAPIPPTNFEQVKNHIADSRDMVLPEPPKPGSYCGFKLPRKISDMRNADEIKTACANIKLECYHCGIELPDVWPIRKHINGSFAQEYRIETKRPDGTSTFYTPPGYTVGFWNPDPASMFVPWRETMIDYVTALKAKEENGLLTPMRVFYQQRWAQPWDAAMSRKPVREISCASYETDPAKLMPNHHCRQMTVDSHKAADAGTNEARIGTFWFECREFDKRGNSIQLARGFLPSWELVAAQHRYWKIPCSRVFIDCSWMPSQVEEAATKYFEVVTPDKKIAATYGDQFALPFASAWRLAEGSGGNRRLTIGGKGAAYMLNQMPQRKSATDRGGRLWNMFLWKLTWSNLYFEMQFDSILSGGVDVTWATLPRDRLIIVDAAGNPSQELLQMTLDRERDNSTYEQQLQSRYFNDRSKKYEDFDKQSRPTEYRDTGLMQLAGIAQDGLLGHVAAPIA